MAYMLRGKRRGNKDTSWAFGLRSWVEDNIIFLLFHLHQYYLLLFVLLSLLTEMRKSGLIIGVGKCVIVDTIVLFRHVKFEMFERYPNRMVK